MNKQERQSYLAHLIIRATELKAGAEYLWHHPDIETGQMAQEDIAALGNIILTKEKLIKEKLKGVE